MNIDDKILVLGSNGLVGSALIRALKAQNYNNILAPSRKDLDLKKQQDVLDYFNDHKPNCVFLAAARVGGIHSNNVYRADFIFENLLIQDNVFLSCFKNDVRKLLVLGSSCIYPREAPQPIKEEYLLTGPLEPTNEPYAIAKIAALKLAENFRRQYNKEYFAVMPTNLYGINDNFHPENGHVIPSLIARIQDAINKNESEFKVWGSGNPRREFLHVDDMANACVFLIKRNILDLPFFLNIGTGEDIKIKDLVHIIAEEMNLEAKIVFDTSKPDGMMRKMLDVSKLKNMGWAPKISLKEGIKEVVHFYRTSKNIRKH